MGFLWDYMGFCGLSWDKYHKNANSGETFRKTSFSEEFIWDQLDRVGLNGFSMGVYGILWVIMG